MEKMEREKKGKSEKNEKTRKQENFKITGNTKNRRIQG